MPILIDLSGVATAAAHKSLEADHVSYSGADIGVLTENNVRYMILNSIRVIRNKFNKEFGEVIICCDGDGYWRKEVFPQYKQNRVKSHSDSKLDYELWRPMLKKVISELHQTFPYKVIMVDRAEADDIIGVLCRTIKRNEPILIYSNDEDFCQLQRYPNVQQYSAMKSKMLVDKEPKRNLQEKIIRGDRGDGVPSIKGKDNCFTAKIRQGSIYQKDLDVWLGMKPEDIEFKDPEFLRNYYRNTVLIDLKNTPDDITEMILDQYADPIMGNRGKIMDYFVEHRLSNLVDVKGNF